MNSIKTPVSDERGDLRIIYSDSFDGALPKMGGQVCALVGPIGRHTSHPELQEALGLVAMAFNRRHGRLSPEKHAEIAKGHEDALSLLDEAIAALRTPEPIEVERVADWLENIIDTDWDEIVADGGITAAMVIQQEARTQAKRLRAVNNLSVERAYREGWRDGLLRENGIEMIEDDWKDSDTFASLQSSSDSGVEP